MRISFRTVLQMFLWLFCIAIFVVSSSCGYCPWRGTSNTTTIRDWRNRIWKYWNYVAMFLSALIPKTVASLMLLADVMPTVARTTINSIGFCLFAILHHFVRHKKHSRTQQGLAAIQQPSLVAQIVKSNVTIKFPGG